MTVVLLPQAQADLDAIADPLLAKIHKRLAALGTYPSLGASLCGPFVGYRASVVGHFRIVYTQASQAVLICYIRDCRRS